MRLAAILLALSAGPGLAESVIATRTIRPQEIIMPGDVRLDQMDIAGSYTDVNDVIGLEAKFALYPGRAVMMGAIGEPAVVDRNQIVELIYSHGGLRIVAEGRSLGRGGVGERIRVMNTGSRTVLFGEIAPDGSVFVSK